MRQPTEAPRLDSQWPVLVALGAALIALLAGIAPGCASGGTRAERLAAVEFEFAEGSATLRDVAVAYAEARPELSQKLVRLAGDLDLAAAAVAAVRVGTGEAAGTVEMIDSLLQATADQVWSDDPQVQADAQVVVAIARAALRRAVREIGG